jgi:hypothetical protein
MSWVLLIQIEVLMVTATICVSALVNSTRRPK